MIFLSAAAVAPSSGICSWLEIPRKCSVQSEGGKKGLGKSLESVIVEPYLMYERVGGGNSNTPHAVAVTQPFYKGNGSVFLSL